MAKVTTTKISPLSQVLWRLAVTLGEIFGAAGILMLFIGAAHDADARIPAIGYWATFSLSVALLIVHRVALAAEEIRKDI